ncbi:conserved hypothetical protein [Thiomonas sp. CB3]|nr:conserved hypothetical protein [Thiomonas sp. CB3]
MTLTCWRRCRCEPHADWRLSHSKRAARRVRFELRHVPKDSQQTRRMAQFDVGTNTKSLSDPITRHPVATVVRPFTFFGHHP